MNKLIGSTVLMVSLVVTTSALADKKDLTYVDDEGRVKITWQSPQDYRDIDPGAQKRSSFRKNLYKEIDEEMEKLAADLPEGQILEMVVTDVDLAGEVFPSNFLGLGAGVDDIRLVERIHIPRMSFSYALKDAQGETLKSDEIDIKDMGFLDRLTVRFREQPFGYEKRMLRDWFQQTLREDVATL